MSRHVLTRHPDTPCTAIERIDATLGRDAHGSLRLTYRLIGDAERVVAPRTALSARPQRRDGLWRHTCCELFVRDATGSGYREYNFAPSGDWAAYRFGDYRKDGVALETAAPRIVLERSPSALMLTVTLDDQPIDALHSLPIGIACIVETPTALSCWALAHPPGRPDFHDVSAFALTFVPEPESEHLADYDGSTSP